jgi:dihydropyrimidinase
MSVLIKGGRVITAADDYVADVYIEGERISLIGESLDVAADKVIDAPASTSCRAAIDPHTHLDMPFGGTTTIDDVESGQTRRPSAARPATSTSASSRRAVVRRRARDLAREGDGKQVIDMGYHIAVTDLHEGGTLEELASLPEQYGRHVLQAVHGLQGRADGRRRDAVPHDGGRREDRRAGDGARRERRRDRRARQARARRRAHRAALARADAPARDRGRGDEPRDPARARRRRAALRRPRLVQGVGRADRARAREGLERLGRDLHAVLLHRLRRPRAEPELRGAKYVYTPPPRDKANQDILWNAVRTDELSAISTDHCAFLWDGQKTLGKDDFSKIPNGGPGIENRLQMIHTSASARAGSR